LEEYFAMRAIELLTIQLNGVNGLYHKVADDLTASEWTTRVFDGCNRIGFTLWHLPRTLDWAVQTVIRGAPEVITATTWSGRGALQTPGIGAGMTPEEADALAAMVSPADVLAYADAVHQTTLE
jgi:DinB superfamily